MSAAVSLPAAPAASANSLAQCPCCGSVYTTEEFLALPTFQEWRIEGDFLGFARCTDPGCTSSMTLRIGDVPTGDAS